MGIGTDMKRFGDDRESSGGDGPISSWSVVVQEARLPSRTHIDESLERNNIGLPVTQHIDEMNITNTEHRYRTCPAPGCRKIWKSFQSQGRFVGRLPQIAVSISPTYPSNRMLSINKILASCNRNECTRLRALPPRKQPPFRALPFQGCQYRQTSDAPTNLSSPRSSGKWLSA